MDEKLVAAGLSLMHVVEKVDGLTIAHFVIHRQGEIIAEWYPATRTVFMAGHSGIEQREAASLSDAVTIAISGPSCATTKGFRKITKEASARVAGQIRQRMLDRVQDRKESTDG